MRAHGIADMPDPGPQDKTLLRKHPDLNPDNPEFKAAVRSCQPGTEVGSPSTSPGTTTATADCDALTACYSASQFQEAYGIRPLLKRGIDGRGITVVLPELAEPQFALRHT
jgi:hypothetical protein